MENIEIRLAKKEDAQFIALLGRITFTETFGHFFRVKQDLLDYIAQLPSPYMREEAMNIVHQHELQDAQFATILPGVTEAVNALKVKNIPMANK